MKRLGWLAAFLLAVQTVAQDLPTAAQDNDSLARSGVYCFITPGGTYFVKMATIDSVSMHDYIVDGLANVTELTIATTSSEVARFYYLEPIVPQSPVGVGQSLIDKAQEKLDEALQRTGQTGVWHRVVKNYPTTTHAHTIEYRVEKKEQLNTLYNAFLNRWLRGQGLFYCKIP